MAEKQNISIVVASDNHYAVLIAALLKSIEQNHKTEEHIDFYIIDDGIHEKTKEKLNVVADPARITIKWCPSKTVIPKHIVIPTDNSAYPHTVYLRIFAPYLVDSNAEKLIYLDVDTLVQADISELWNTDISEYLAAAVQDVGKTVDCKWGGIPNYAQLGLSKDTWYFNSGVLMMNLVKWRAENISENVIESLYKYKEFVILPDQYGLNVTLANRWLPLDPKWNWFAFAENENPAIIHFLDIKPIFTTYNSQESFKKEFFKYLDQTPWKNFKLISGNRRYIRKIYNKLKNIFNL
ncbi:glycosyltransferase family 8 protein [Pedobacter sp. MW01-1-1]|uniref:glycosyltransferase family 8 protein n=1 Tax=Pedobacter sp. MW01-1-1 TaxID=3383027 RepID=UPI003FF14633